MKRFLCVFFSSIALLLAINFSCSLILSAVNFNKNNNMLKLNPIEGTISNQWDYEDYNYGFGNVGANGCGAVAIYNLLVLEGKNPNFASIIRSMDIYGTIFFGCLGTNPLGVFIYLKSCGYNVNISFNQSDFYNLSKQSKYSILSYWSLKGGHYQLMYGYNESTDCLRVLNPNHTINMNEELSLLKDYPIKILFTINWQRGIKINIIKM